MKSFVLFEVPGDPTKSFVILLLSYGVVSEVPLVSNASEVAISLVFGRCVYQRALCKAWCVM